eukprot:6267743-Alexandrium_andersonii.AAC.1
MDAALVARGTFVRCAVPCSHGRLLSGCSASRRKSEVHVGGHVQLHEHEEAVQEGGHRRRDE